MGVLHDEEERICQLRVYCIRAFFVSFRKYESNVSANQSKCLPPALCFSVFHLSIHSAKVLSHCLMTALLYSCYLHLSLNLLLFVFNLLCCICYFFVSAKILFVCLVSELSLLYNVCV